MLRPHVAQEAQVQQHLLPCSPACKQMLPCHSLSANLTQPQCRSLSATASVSQPQCQPDTASVLQPQCQPDTASVPTCHSLSATASVPTWHRRWGASPVRCRLQPCLLRAAPCWPAWCWTSLGCPSHGPLKPQPRLRLQTAGTASRDEGLTLPTGKPQAPAGIMMAHRALNTTRPLCGEF